MMHFALVNPNTNAATTTAMFTASIATILHMLKRARAGITIITTMM